VIDEAPVLYEFLLFSSEGYDKWRCSSNWMMANRWKGTVTVAGSSTKRTRVVLSGAGRQRWRFASSQHLEWDGASMRVRRAIARAPNYRRECIQMSASLFTVINIERTMQFAPIARLSAKTTDCVLRQHPAARRTLSPDPKRDHSIPMHMYRPTPRSNTDAVCRTCIPPQPRRNAMDVREHAGVNVSFLF